MNAARRSTEARGPLLAGLVSLCLTVGLLLLGSSAALAAGPPVIEGESFSGVGSSNATLSAEIDPNGSSTSYHWEYGPSEALGRRRPKCSSAKAKARCQPRRMWKAWM